MEKTCSFLVVFVSSSGPCWGRVLPRGGRSAPPCHHPAPDPGHGPGVTGPCSPPSLPPPGAGCRTRTRCPVGSRLTSRAGWRMRTRCPVGSRCQQLRSSAPSSAVRGSGTSDGDTGDAAGTLGAAPVAVPCHGGSDRAAASPGSPPGPPRSPPGAPREGWVASTGPHPGSSSRGWVPVPAGGTEI